MPLNLLYLLFLTDWLQHFTAASETLGHIYGLDQTNMCHQV